MSYLVGALVAPFFWLVVLSVALLIVRKFIPRSERLLFTNPTDSLPACLRFAVNSLIVCLLLGWLWLAVTLARY